MSNRMAKYALLLVAGVLAGCSQMTAGTRQTANGAQLFRGMGRHTRAITATSSEAQRYFDQGLIWAYAFNYDEAARSFNQAAVLDPECPMAYWGVALVNGPHINNPVMSDEQSQAAWNAIQHALAHLDRATPVERDLIQALAKRYTKPWPKDRKAYDEAYSTAMAGVHSTYPDDADVGTLYAESMMDLEPWNLYTKEGKPHEITGKIVAVLEDVLAHNPNHPGANHLYIHAVEPSDHPERGLASADRLRNMVPASGHLLHMPSHVDVLVGQWDKAIEQNEKAMRSDEHYRRIAPPQKFQHLYQAHNSHMLAFAAMMSGREKEAMTAARAILKNVPSEAAHQFGPFLDYMMCAVYDVQKRFGRWDDLLAESPPPPFLPISNAMWRANRAIAYAAKKDFVSADLEHEEFRRIVDRLPDDYIMVINPAKKVMAVADQLVAGEIALQKGDLKRAAVELAKGVALEDQLVYMEPPEWIQPVRHTLGAVLISDRRYADAERVYREDLKHWPNNGWSLYGLSRALEGQQKAAEAANVKARYREAWKHADEPIATSCKCIPNT